MATNRPSDFDGVRPASDSERPGFNNFATIRTLVALLLIGAFVYGAYFWMFRRIVVGSDEVLVLLRKALGIAIEIVPDDGLRIDRSLDSSRFRSEFDYRPPTWEQMADELAHHHCGARP